VRQEEGGGQPGDHRLLMVGLLSLSSTLGASVWRRQRRRASQPRARPALASIWGDIAAKSMKSGSAGLVAGVAQVFAFMWLRTTMNYQYFNGGSLWNALAALWREGGLSRFYQGVGLALIQAPLSRFGSTAANTGVLLFTEHYCPGMSVAVQTALASVAVSLWRFLLTPIETLKTVLQVQGASALAVLVRRVMERGIGELYSGALANFGANWVGNYPYFAMFNFLSSAWPKPLGSSMRIVRNGVIGMCASITSDVISNSLRVLKTVRQSSPDADLSYVEAARSVVKKDGLWGLFGRGLETRLLVNVLQGAFFTILWKVLEDGMAK